MKSIHGVLLAALCIGSSGCYDFDFPLDPTPEVSIDVRLVGAWRCLGVRADAEEPAFVLRIAPRTDKIAEWTLESAMADGSKETGHLDVHGSTVKGHDLLNVLEKGERANGKWNIVQYSFLLPDVLRLQAVDDTSFEKAKTSPAVLRKAIEKRRGDPSIYNAFAVCVRAKVVTPEAAPAPSPKD